MTTKLDKLNKALQEQGASKDIQNSFLRTLVQDMKEITSEVDKMVEGMSPEEKETLSNAVAIILRSTASKLER